MPSCIYAPALRGKTRAATQCREFGVDRRAIRGLIFCPAAHRGWSASAVGDARRQRALPAVAVAGHACTSTIAAGYFEPRPALQRLSIERLHLSGSRSAHFQHASHLFREAPTSEGAEGAATAPAAVAAAPAAIPAAVVTAGALAAGTHFHRTPTARQHPLVHLGGTPLSARPGAAAPAACGGSGSRQDHAEADLALVSRDRPQT